MNIAMAFALYLVVVVPGAAPSVTQVGVYSNGTECNSAARDAQYRPNEGISPSYGFICVRLPAK